MVDTSRGGPSVPRCGNPSDPRACAGFALLACLCAFAASGCAQLEPLTRGLGNIRGEVFVGEGQKGVAELGPVVVYLENRHEAVSTDAGTLTLDDDRDGRFGRDLVILTRGQALRFSSSSGIAHRLFAIRGPERVDVTVSESGESRIVPMEQTGWIRFYCSLHQDENWDVFVSPSPHFARLDRQGRYRIDNVPHGDYELSIWSAKVSGPVRPVRVGFWTSTHAPIWLDPAKIAP
jgi:plastocyanin